MKRNLEKCSLCESLEDPRFGATCDGRNFPLCDGCGGPENATEAAALFAKLRALPPLPPPREYTFEVCVTTHEENCQVVHDWLQTVLDERKIRSVGVKVLGGARTDFPLTDEERLRMTEGSGASLARAMGTPMPGKPEGGG